MSRKGKSIETEILVFFRDSERGSGKYRVFFRGNQNVLQLER